MSSRQLYTCLIIFLAIPVSSALAAEKSPWLPLVEEHCVPLGIPKELALAFIDIESKGNPLAINIVFGNGEHKGYLHQDAKVAHDALIDALSQSKIVGIGLMQITFKYHADKMKTPSRFFEPVTNISYGCRYLSNLLKEPGPLWKRIGRYHSANNNFLKQNYTFRIIKCMRYHMKGGGESCLE